MASTKEAPNAHQPLTVPILTAASMLGISRSTFYELLAAGEFEIIKVGRRTLVLVDSLKAFVEARRDIRRAE